MSPNRFRVSEEMPEPLNLLVTYKSRRNSESSVQSRKASKRPAATLEAPRVKRKQTSYPDSTKTAVVYEVICNGVTKAGISKLKSVPESTIRGWVKTAKSYLKAAKAEGRDVRLTCDGFVESGPSLGENVPTSVASFAKEPSSPCRSSETVPPRLCSSGSTRRRKRSAPASCHRADNADAASVSTVPSSTSSPDEHITTSNFSTGDDSASDRDINSTPIPISDGQEALIYIFSALLEFNRESGNQEIWNYAMERLNNFLH